MKTRGGIVKKILIGLLACAIVAVLGWVFALPTVVCNRVTTYTGCPASARAINVNPFGGNVRLVDFRLRNPAGFPEPDFVDLALLDIDVAMLSLGSDEIRVAHAIVDLKKVTLVTAKDGTTNSGAVKKRLDAATGPATQPEPQEPETTQRFRIGELVIRIGSIEHIDYSRGTEPVRHTVLINADHRFKDVTDFKVIVRPLLADLAKANAGALLGTFGGLLPGPFRDSLGGALDGASGAVKKLIDSLPVGR
jgi:uncharacterized protein involved in outer membrane biogenesis